LKIQKHLMMKKIIFCAVAILAIMFTSCNQQVPQKTTTTVTTEKVTYSDQGFYVEQQTVVSGNTVWGISSKVYGTGLQWRDIIALNPFLNTPDRLYYNADRKMWIIRIYPGEVLNIGGQKVYPSCSYESSITETTTEPVSSSSNIIPWWGWLIIVILVIAFILLMLNLFGIYNPINGSSSSSSSSSAVHVDIHNGGNIDLATRAALLGREMDFRNRVVGIAEESAKNNQLARLFIEENPDEFTMSAKFFNQRKEEKPEVKPVVDQKVEPIKEEGK
jgi:hypothetical protein